MNFSLNSGTIAVYIFLALLVIFYILARIINSGPIKIRDGLRDNGTFEYISVFVAMIIIAAILTFFIVKAMNLPIDFKAIFGT